MNQSRSTQGAEPNQSQRINSHFRSLNSRFSDGTHPSLIKIKNILELLNILLCLKYVIQLKIEVWNEINDSLNFWWYK